MGGGQFLYYCVIKRSLATILIPKFSNWCETDNGTTPQLKMMMLSACV